MELDSTAPLLWKLYNGVTSSKSVASTRSGFLLFIRLSFDEAFSLGPDTKPKGKKQQKGMGDYTLCKRCNNNEDFASLVEAGRFIIGRSFFALWDETGVDPEILQASEPVFFDFSQQRAAQKAVFGGEFHPAKAHADHKSVFLDYFQNDKNTGRPKGIVKINLETFP